MHDKKIYSRKKGMGRMYDVRIKLRLDPHQPGRVVERMDRMPSHITATLQHPGSVAHPCWLPQPYRA